MTSQEGLKQTFTERYNMAKFGEIVYMVLDLLKESSDDSFYTEEHVLFLAKKMRAMLLERKYKGTRNSSYSAVSGENKQQICLMLEPAALLPDGCGGKWLRSTQPVPDFVSDQIPVACTGHDMLQTMVTFIPVERMPYVGYNKWLKKFIYAAKSKDGHLYLTSSNPQFINLQRVGLTGVFSDPEAAAALSHEACQNGGVCDIMAQEFPLEASLVPSCVELVAQELSVVRYAPKDGRNNAKDDLTGLGISGSAVSAPAEDGGARNFRALGNEA